MKFDVETITATKRRLKVEIPVEEINAALDKAYAELNHSVKVPGFRPGKAPRSILEKRYAETVEADVVEKLVPEFYYRAAEEAKIVPVEHPKFEGDALKIKKGEPLSFTAAVEVRPEFTPAPYRGIEVKDEPVIVTDEELSEALNELREMHSTLETVEDERPAASGDHVVIDFEGFIGGEAIKGGRAENYTLLLGSGSFIPGFEDGLIGANKGESRDISVKFPDDYKSKDLAGKDAVFKANLKELKRKVLPELDDEFASDLGLGGTIAKLKDKVGSDILTMKKRSLAARQKDQIIKDLASKNDFELPESLVENEVRSLVMRRYEELTSGGRRPSEGIDPKAFAEEAKPAARERVKTALVLSRIAEDEGITATDADLDEGIRRIAHDTGYNPKEIKELYKKKDGSLDRLRGVIGEEKVLDFLLEKSKKV